MPPPAWSGPEAGRSGASLPYTKAMCIDKSPRGIVVLGDSGQLVAGRSGAMPVDLASDAGGEVGQRLPAEQLESEGGRSSRSLDVARLSRRHANFDAPLASRRDLLDEPDHRRRRASGNVEHRPRGDVRGAGQDGRSDHVVHIGEIADLLAVAEQREGLAGER